MGEQRVNIGGEGEGGTLCELNACMRYMSFSIPIVRQGRVIICK